MKSVYSLSFGRNEVRVPMQQLELQVAEYIQGICAAVTVNAPLRRNLHPTWTETFFSNIITVVDAYRRINILKSILSSSSDDAENLFNCAALLQYHLLHCGVFTHLKGKGYIFRCTFSTGA